MRDHREGRDPEPVNITDAVAAYKEAVFREAYQDGKKKPHRRKVQRISRVDPKAKRQAQKMARRRNR